MPSGELPVGEVTGGKCQGSNCPWGKLPGGESAGGNCPGVKCPRTGMSCLARSAAAISAFRLEAEAVKSSTYEVHSSDVDGDIVVEQHGWRENEALKDCLLVDILWGFFPVVAACVDNSSFRKVQSLLTMFES